MLTQLHTLATNVQQAITALKGHPIPITNLVVQAHTIPNHKETLHWTVYHVILVITALDMETISQPTVAVLGFIVQEEIMKHSQARHAALQVTTADKNHTT